MRVWVLAARLVLVALLVFVAFLSISPTLPDDNPGNAVSRAIAQLLLGGVEHADKVSHFIAYGVLGGVAFFAVVFRRPVWAAPALITLFGIGLESIQYFTPGRSADGVDAMVNMLGAFVGFGAGAALVQMASPLKAFR